MGKENFVDHVSIYVYAGRGGDGVVHFHRDKFTIAGGPDGGTGGRGGHVVLRGDRNLWTLLPLRYRKHIRAPHGQPGGAAERTGKQGADVILDVPVGVTVKDADTGETLGEILQHGQTLIVAHGGKGGRGNAAFKSPTNRTPHEAEKGQPGEERHLILELKTLADVGLVGFPNAGKSTLLSRLSAARPRIADYPFTTLTPQLGVVAVDPERSFVMADIPGLIEGAHQGRGLGHRFLRHIERNPVLLFLISVENLDDIEPRYEALKKELAAYQPELLDRPRLIALTKADLLDAEMQQELKKELHLPDPYLLISSVTGQGITELKERLWRLIESARREKTHP